MEYRILKSEEIKKAFALREEVFVDEQKVPLEYEVDDRDSLEDTIHVGVFEGDELLATARIMNINKDIVYFGRACVKKSCRGKGVGKFLFISMEETVKKFISRIEKKEGVDPKLLQNNPSLKNEPGTPENIFYEYNELIREYNKLSN